MSRRRAFVATVGSGADLMGRQSAQFMVLVVLARLATPSEFGTFALLATVALIGMVLSDAGLGTAILQTNSLTDEDLDTAFWVTVTAGCLLAGITALSAFPLAEALGRVHSWPVSASLALAVLALSMGQVPTALLVKRAAFLRLLVVGVSATLLSGAVAVVVAVRSDGLWGLTVQAITMPVANTVLLWVCGGYRPRRRWNRDSATRLIGSSRWVLAANIVDASFLRLQALVIGSAFGPSSLGRYQRADSTQQLPADATSAVVGRVVIPLFAESAHRPDLVRAGFLTGIRSVSAVNAPVMAMLAVLSTPVMVTLYGPQWRQAGPLLAILASAGLMWPLHAMAVNLLYSLSRNRFVFQIDLIKKAVAVTALAIGALVGFEAVAWAQVLFGLAALMINGAAVRRAIGISLRQQILEVAPVVGTAAISGFAILALATRWSTAPLTEVLVLGTAGIVLYLALAAVFRVRAVLDLVALAFPKLLGARG